MMIRLKTSKREPVFFGLAILIMAAAIWFGLSHPVNYSNKERGNISYVSAKVIQVSHEEISRNDEGVHRGVQDLKVRPLEGSHKGETLEAHNILNLEHSIFLRENDRFILCIDESPGGGLLTSVHGYRRSTGIYLAGLLFLAVLILTCGKQGLRSAFGLMFGFVMLIYLSIPMISLGVQPSAAVFASILPILAVSLISLTGFTRKTIVTILSTFVGTLLAALIFRALGALLHISGYNLEDIETLVVVAQKHPIHIRDLLFSGVLISCLGAIMDVAVSVVSGVEEVCKTNHADRNALFRSGLQLGRDATGATVNTLILAFVGTFFVTLFLFHIYDIDYVQLMNMDDISIEIAQALSGATALALTAPITAFIASRLLATREKPPGKARKGKK
ncbi:MAG: YibE/F family protein [Clostridiales Family XIII bacterium]|jgi:uncharacterized membrane protein|nr:YibE/F family protein [Clostridiales Family XIII bacterium]